MSNNGGKVHLSRSVRVVCQAAAVSSSLIAPICQWARAYLFNSRKTVRVSLTDCYAYLPFLLFLNYIGMRLGVGQRVFFEYVFRRILETSELRTVLWENPDFYLCSEVSFTTSTKHEYMDSGLKK